MYYLDNAATTKVLPEILSVMNQYLGEYYYNPSSVYMPSVNVKKDVEKVRDYILDVVGASNHKVIFTSSATEANNTIFNSVNLRSGDKVLISSVEHPSVYNKAITLREKGVIVEQIKCDKKQQKRISFVFFLCYSISCIYLFKPNLPFLRDCISKYFNRN